MIEKTLAFQFVKKSPFYGSYKGMRYRICKKEREIEGTEDKETVLEVCIYPEPYGFDATPEEQKTYHILEFSEEGYEKAFDLLNEQYEALYKQDNV